MLIWIRSSLRNPARLIQVKSRPAVIPHPVANRWESDMPIESILFLGLVAAALAVFTATLSYAEWATRHATDSKNTHEQSKANAPVGREPSATTRKAA